MKQCNKCQNHKALIEFDFQRNTCKSCRYEYKKTLIKPNNDILVIEQKCSCCKIIKLSDQFHPERTRITGLYPYCKSCVIEKQKAKYQKNKEKYLKLSSERYQEIRCTDEYRAKARKHRAERTKTDPKFKLKRKLRNRLYYALKKKSWKKNTHFSEYIGCSLDELKSHLEKQFIEGMNWDNHGEWHIDHIIPLDSAQSDEELYKLCHYTNLQPLWAIDNIKKANKI